MQVVTEADITFIETLRGWMWVDFAGASSYWFASMDAARSNYESRFE